MIDELQTIVATALADYQGSRHKMPAEPDKRFSVRVIEGEEYAPQANTAHAQVELLLRRTRAEVDALETDAYSLMNSIGNNTSSHITNIQVTGAPTYQIYGDDPRAYYALDLLVTYNPV